VSTNGEPRKMGRPALGDGLARVPAFTVRLSEGERAAVYAAAEKAGKPVTQWAREAIVAAALACPDPWVQGEVPSRS
jgi:hypothetical protein